MKNTYIILVAFAFTFMCSCAKDSDHNKEQGIALSIETTVPTDPISQVTVWIFSKTDHVLRHEHRFTKFDDLASTLLPISAGEYDVVVVTNVTPSFEHNAIIGETKSEELLLNIKNASSSPHHLHYGSAKVEVSPTRITPLKVAIKRALAQIQLTIKDLESTVTRASAEILNSSDGFYPAAEKLSTNSAMVSLNEVAVNENHKIVFPTQRLMPVVPLAGRYEQTSTEVKTLMQLIFRYESGYVLSFQVEMPQIENGGEYRVEISGYELQPGVTLQITPINGWQDNTPINGEILNPNN